MRQLAGIDGVGLAEDAMGADERLDLARVGAVGGDIHDREDLQKPNLVATCGFTDDKAGLVECGRECLDIGGAIGDFAGAGATMFEEHEGGFADIAADEPARDWKHAHCGLTSRGL